VAVESIQSRDWHRYTMYMGIPSHPNRLRFQDTMIGSWRPALRQLNVAGYCSPTLFSRISSTGQTAIPRSMITLSLSGKQERLRPIILSASLRATIVLPGMQQSASFIRYSILTVDLTTTKNPSYCGQTQHSHFSPIRPAAQNLWNPHGPSQCSKCVP
jgi:hypothetical protein